MTMTPKEQLKIIQQGAVTLVSEQELLKKLESNRSLRVKYGADPSAPDIHLGHTVALNKLKQLQDLGHHIVFIIGDFTALIGDPSGRSETRKPLSKETIVENAKTYQKQIFKILDSKKTEVLYNSKWLSKMPLEQVLVQLASRATVAQMLERDDFSKRYREGNPITVLEFLYPLMQAYDSVAVRSDIEIGGTDQTFNFLLGRDLQRLENQEPQVVLTLPLLEGTDGVQKMSKSFGNYIGITESANEIFGKVMSLSDVLMEKYYTLLTDVNIKEVQSSHPMEAKKRLASLLVERFYNEKESKKALEHFETVFSKREVPQEMIDFPTSQTNWVAATLVAQTGCAQSSSEAYRLIQQGAFKLNSLAVKDPKTVLQLQDGDVIKVGKRRFVKILLKK